MLRSIALTTILLVAVGSSPAAADGTLSGPIPAPSQAAAPGAELHFQRSLEHLQAAQVDSAIGELFNMLERAPDDRRGHRALVRIHAAQERLWESYRIFDDLRQRYPRLVAPLLTLGEIELLRDHPERAVLQFEKAAVLDQDQAAAMGGMARARLALEQASATLDYFDQRLFADPRSIASRYGKATILAGQGKYKAAATQFKWAITLDPECWLAERDYGRMLLLNDQLDLACKHLARAIEILEAENDPATAGELRPELTDAESRRAQSARSDEEQD